MGSNTNNTSIFRLWHSFVTTTWWHSDLGDDVSLFSSYFSFLHLRTACSPQAHLHWLQSSHCIVTVYILTHNVLPASPGRAQEKVKNQQQPPSMLTARLLKLLSTLLVLLTLFHSYTLTHTRYPPSCLVNQIPDQSIQPITKDPITTKLIHFLDQSSTLTTPTPTSTCNARACQMLRRHTHLRGAPSSHRRGVIVNSFKLVPPAGGYGLPCCYEPLCSSPVVEPAGMTSSIPCHELEFKPSRHCGASYTMATWPPRDRKTAQVAEWGKGGGEERGGGICSLGWMEETEQRGGG